MMNETERMRRAFSLTGMTFYASLRLATVVFVAYVAWHFITKYW